MATRPRAPRVLFCTDTYPPQVNGVSVVTELSVQGLERRGWECAVVAPRYPTFAGSHRVLTLPSAAAPGYPDLRLASPAYRLVADTIDHFRPDIVHSSTEFVVGRLGQLAAGRRGLRRTSSYHTDFSRYADAYRIAWLRAAVSGYIGRFHRRSLRVFTPSRPARDDLARLGVHQAEIWGRGVDTTTFTPARRGPLLRESFALGSRFTFLYVGRFAAEKNVELILEAYARASAMVPRGVMRLVLAGTGPRTDVLRAIAPPDVSFLGHLPRTSMLPDLYANCDAFVFASTTETLGLVVLEAMASGLPVIAAPAGGVVDHLRDGINGVAYPPGDAAALAAAMVHLVADPLRAMRLGAAARITAESLSWERELDRLDESLLEVLREPSAASRRGKPAAHRRPAAQLALGRDPAAMRFDQMLDDRQA